MDVTKNFHDTIKELEEKLDDSLDSLVDTNVRYRTAHDRIDQLSQKIFETKAQILELVYSLNELLDKSNLDLSAHKIDMFDLKKMTNDEALRLINTIMRYINEKL